MSTTRKIRKARVARDAAISRANRDYATACAAKQELKVARIKMQLIMEVMVNALPREDIIHMLLGAKTRCNYELEHWQVMEKPAFSAMAASLSADIITNESSVHIHTLYPLIIKYSELPFGNRVAVMLENNTLMINTKSITNIPEPWLREHIQAGMAKEFAKSIKKGW